MMTKGRSAPLALGGIALGSWAVRQALTRRYSFAGKVA